MLISTRELAAELESSGSPLLLDLRPAERFARGSLPGAFHLDLWGLSLTDTSEAPLQAFSWMIAHLFSLRGVTAERPVVVYEEDSGIRAARALWFLDYFGHPRARVLDGGINAWIAEGLPLSRDFPAPTPSDWHGTPRRDLVASWQYVRARIGSPEVQLLDTRSDAEYYGELVRAKRAGAIPGAINVDWTNNLTSDGRFKSPAELAAMYGEAGLRPGAEVIAYCQGGYRAAHGYMALRLAGYPDVRNYTGSWREWGDREDLPIERPTRP
jgi:thiosulfate/3-mercaptopyruvate sulfurtransferase